MSKEISIGLAELIEKVKQELLTTYPNGKTDIPFLCVDSVELELQVTVKKEGKGGVKISVLPILDTVGGELTGGVSRDDVQKLKIKLSPLFSKEQLLENYKNLNPENWEKLLKTSSKALTKGGSNLRNQY